MERWGVLPWTDAAEMQLQDARVLNKVLLHERTATPAGEAHHWATGLLVELRGGGRALAWYDEARDRLATASPADLAPITADLVKPPPP